MPQCIDVGGNTKEVFGILRNPTDIYKHQKLLAIDYWAMRATTKRLRTEGTEFSGRCGFNWML